MDHSTLDARLRTKALACVAQREHSRVELRRKLLNYLERRARADADATAAAAAAASAPTTAAATAVAERWAGPEVTEPTDDEAQPDASRVDAVLDWLAERDLINAERFVETRVQARLGRFGHRRIRQELWRHGVELDTASDQRLRDSELARAHALWARRFETPTDVQARAKQMRFLLARGFSADVAVRVLRGVGAEEPDEF